MTAWGWVALWALSMWALMVEVHVHALRSIIRRQNADIDRLRLRLIAAGLDDSIDR